MVPCGTRLLQDVRIVNLGLNTPGPIAAARFVKLGAAVTKIEPPSGDPLKEFARPWYEELCAGQTVLSLDLKKEAGRAAMEHHLSSADLLLASFRPSALARLGLDWRSLQSRHPRLSFTGIIGYPHPNEERSGHDLTYLSDTGLLSPPQLPSSLYVDLAGAERAVTLSLALLLNSFRTGKAGCAWVSLHECAWELAAPRRAGLTTLNGSLGGNSPFYSMYPASDGWIAVAALEPHFASRLLSELNLSAAGGAELQRVFRGRSAAEWESWGEERGLPLAAVRV